MKSRVRGRTRAAAWLIAGFVAVAGGADRGAAAEAAAGQAPGQAEGRRPRPEGGRARAETRARAAQAAAVEGRVALRRRRRGNADDRLCGGQTPARRAARRHGDHHAVRSLARRSGQRPRAGLRHRPLCHAGGLDGRAGAAPKPGASVLVRTTGTDTGERREILGQQARHLKLVTTTEPSPQACDKKKGRVETDGWFADIPELQECAGAKALRAAVEPAGTCRDPRVEEHAGIEVSGFPLAYSVVAFDGAGKEISKLVVEVTALTRENLSAPLFEPPSEFAALPDADALAAAARRVELEELGTTPKLAGMIRIGVAPPGDRSGKGVAADSIRSGLLEDFSTRPFEAIPLSAGTPEEQQAEARKKECDYVIRAELGTLTTSTPGRVGGLVRRASGGGSPTEIHEAGVAVELIPVTAAAARPKKMTASAKTGAFTWRRAVGLARFAGKLYFGMTGGMMTSLMNSSGGGGGGPLGGGDPTVNALMMLLGPGAGGEPSDDLTTPAAVVAAAFQKAAADVMKELQPK